MVSDLIYEEILLSETKSFSGWESTQPDQGLSATQQAAELGYLNQLNTAAAGSYASSSAVRDAFDAIMAARAGNAIFQGITRITNLTTFTMTDPQMQAVFPVAALEAEIKVDAWLAGIPQSNERIALVSLAYNNLIGVNPGGTFKSPTLRQAIIDDNRAEAWYQIRYESNGGLSRITSGEGIANRRITESDLFSLYDNPGQSVGEAEAKEVLRMYTIHRTGIQAYESQFPTQFAPSGTVTIQFQLTGTETTLIANFAEGRTIDGEVLVGQNEVFPGDILEGTASGDLLFGERGNDVLRGGAGTDVLYGGEGIDTLSGGAENDLLRGEAGDDTLQGGTGNDRLEGGAGFDTYIYNAGDGTDRIEDSDARGQIIFNGKRLLGGLHRPNDPLNTYKSLDGLHTYVLSGTDLVVDGLLTVNENFQSGQFGISLIDAPSIATAAPPTFRTIVGDFQPLDTDPVEPGVQIGFDDLGNVIQDPQSPGDRSDLLTGSGNNDQMNGGALRDRLTALGGSDILTGGSDGDVLIGQDGNDQLFADQLVNISSLVSFENFGGTVGTGMPGDFLTGGINDDVLVGGVGNDALYGGTGKDLILGGASNDVLRNWRHRRMSARFIFAMSYGP